jgi:hypothetical protein
MNKYIKDLTPFFADQCWMQVLLARQPSVGVILRRGPTQWWRVTLWETRRDRFEGGQWFRGRIYRDPTGSCSSISLANSVPAVLQRDTVTLGPLSSALRA